MESELAWGVFTRLVGVVAFVAIAPLYWQIVENCGSRSYNPIAPRLAQMRSDFPLPVLLLHVPTVLWLCGADWFLKALVVMGSLSGLLAVYGGAFSHWALLGCFLLLVADRAMDQMFPWDCLLLEMLAMSALLPALEPLPALRAVGGPWPVQGFFFNMLLLRLMLGFGKMKFVGATRKDHTYLGAFLINQPLPSPLGWYAYHLPAWAHKLGLVLLFAAEIPLPFLALLPGPVRLLPFGATLALMLAIHSMGTFGYFNLVVAVLCVPLLDFQASIFNFRWEQATGSWYGLGCTSAWGCWPSAGCCASRSTAGARVRGCNGPRWRTASCERLQPLLGVLPLAGRPAANPRLRRVPATKPAGGEVHAGAAGQPGRAGMARL